MRLHRAVDGHYYITGPIFAGGPFSTFQISPMGVDVLARCGVSEEQQIPQDIFLRLHREKHIWTGGGGVGDPTRELSLDDLEGLLGELKGWGWSGNAEELRAFLSEHHSKMSVASLFPESFCRWTIQQEVSISPDSLADLSFYDVYENLLSPKCFEGSYLHERLLQEVEGCKVLYHWMRWLAEVHGVKKRQGSCPEVWKDTLHETIFNLLTFHMDKGVTSTNIWKRLAPFVQWRMLEGSIELVFPQQVSPKGADISLTTNNRLVHLSYRDLDRNILWFEARHPIDDPGSPLHWQCDYRWQARSYGYSSARFPHHQILLWKSDGSYIEPTEMMHPTVREGFLFLLAHRSRIEEIRSCGIDLNPRNGQMEPAGWEDWYAHKIEIPPAVESLGPYRLPASTPSIHLIIPAPPTIEVNLAHSIPVYFGEWPLIEIHSSEETVEVTISSGNERIGIVVSDPSAIKQLDLNRYADAAQLFGTIKFRSSCTSVSGCDFSGTEFVRLPGWRMRYFTDAEGGMASAVRISNVETGTRIVSHEHGKVADEDSTTFVATAEDPLQQPIVFLGWERSGRVTVPFSVYLPVKRGAFVEKGSGLPKWQALPLKMGTAQFKDLSGEVRIELSEDVQLHEAGACQIKASVGPQSRAGYVVGRFVRMPVDRLKEFINSRSEALYIRTKSRWECFIELEAPPGPPIVEVSQPEISVALWNGREKELRDTWQECFKSFSADRTDKRDWFNLFLGSHIGDWKGAGMLLRRLDIPEVTYLRLRCTLRCHFWDLEAEQLQREIRSLDLSSYKTFTEGEYWYRFARSRSIEAPGALEASYDRLVTLAPPDPTTVLEAFCIASFIAIVQNKRMPQPVCQESPINQFLDSVYRYLNQPCQRDFYESLPEIPACFAILLVPEDVSFLLLCKAQIERNLKNSREMLDLMYENRKMYPVLYELLSARQYRFEGFEEKASEVYRSIVTKRGFILDEIFS